MVCGVLVLKDPVSREVPVELWSKEVVSNDCNDDVVKGDRNVEFMNDWMEERASAGGLLDIESVNSLTYRV